MESQSSAVEELGKFFDLFYGDQTGFAYSPVKTATAFNQHFFQWPYEKARLIAHCLKQRGSGEVYFSPVLYSRRGAEKEDFLGTSYVWCDFDGNAPEEVAGIPKPSLVVRSSGDKNQHWYWRLDHFETDIEVVESITKRIAYQEEGDKGCWNVNRVLRPPFTTHHESNKTVEIISQLDREDNLNVFHTLQELPQIEESSEENIGHIPSFFEVIAKYEWTLEEQSLLTTKTIESGNGRGRSHALAKAAHYCMEKGTTNAEALGLLLVLDNRWGKYAKRSDQKKRLIEIINYARSKHAIDPVTEEADDPLKVYTYDEFMHQKFEVDWVVPGLIHKKGIVLLAGPPNVGKSSLTLRFCQKIATGQPFLKWKIEKPRKMLYISMEMPREELGTFLVNMKFDPNDAELLRENFHIMPLGQSLRLGNVQAKAAIIKKLEELQPDGVVFDSLGTTIADDMMGDKIILDIFDFVRAYVNGRFGAFAWFIHHPRKAQIGNKKPNKLDDLYGNQYIGGQITTGMILWPGAGSNQLELSCVKMRMAEWFQPFRLERKPNLEYTVREGGGHTFGKGGSNSPIFGDLNGIGETDSMGGLADSL